MICASKNQGKLLHHHPHIHEIKRVKIRYGNPTRVFVIAPDQSHLIYVIYIDIAIAISILSFYEPSISLGPDSSILQRQGPLSSSGTD